MLKFWHSFSASKAFAFDACTHKHQKQKETAFLTVDISSVADFIFVFHFYARKRNASRVFAIVWASVHLSVCPSVTLVSCIKTVQARITKSSPWTAPRSLVYRDKISCSWVRGFSSNEGVNEEYPLKRYFAVIGSYRVKTVADQYRHATYHNKYWWRVF